MNADFNTMITKNTDNHIKTTLHSTMQASHLPGLASTIPMTDPRVSSASPLYHQLQPSSGRNGNFIAPGNPESTPTSMFSMGTGLNASFTGSNPIITQYQQTSRAFPVDSGTAMAYVQSSRGIAEHRIQDLTKPSYPGSIPMNFSPCNTAPPHQTVRQMIPSYPSLLHGPRGIFPNYRPPNQVSRLRHAYSSPSVSATPGMTSSSTGPTANTSQSEVHDNTSSRKKRKACGHCKPCQRKENCNTCMNCVNRAKGKQICIHRKCEVLKKKPGSSLYSPSSDVMKGMRKSDEENMQIESKRRRSNDVMPDFSTGLTHPTFHPNFGEFGDLSRTPSHHLAANSSSFTIRDGTLNPSINELPSYFNNPVATQQHLGSGVLPEIDIRTPPAAVVTEQPNYLDLPVMDSRNNPNQPGTNTSESRFDQMQRLQQQPSSQQPADFEWISELGNKPLERLQLDAGTLPGESSGILLPPGPGPGNNEIQKYHPSPNVSIARRAAIGAASDTARQTFSNGLRPRHAASSMTSLSNQDSALIPSFNSSIQTFSSLINSEQRHTIHHSGYPNRGGPPSVVPQPNTNLCTISQPNFLPSDTKQTNSINQKIASGVSLPSSYLNSNPTPANVDFSSVQFPPCQQNEFMQYNRFAMQEQLQPSIESMKQLALPATTAAGGENTQEPFPQTNLLTRSLEDGKFMNCSNADYRWGFEQQSFLPRNADLSKPSFESTQNIQIPPSIRGRRRSDISSDRYSTQFSAGRDANIGSPVLHSPYAAGVNIKSPMQGVATSQLQQLASSPSTAAARVPTVSSLPNVEISFMPNQTPSVEEINAQDRRDLRPWTDDSSNMSSTASTLNYHARVAHTVAPTDSFMEKSNVTPMQIDTNRFLAKPGSSCPQTNMPCSLNAAIHSRTSAGLCDDSSVISAVRFCASKIPTQTESTGHVSSVNTCEVKSLNDEYLHESEVKSCYGSNFGVLSNSNPHNLPKTTSVESPTDVHSTISPTESGYDSADIISAAGDTPSPGVTSLQAEKDINIMLKQQNERPKNVKAALMRHKVPGESSKSLPFGQWTTNCAPHYNLAASVQHPSRPLTPELRA